MLSSFSGLSSLSQHKANLFDDDDAVFKPTFKASFFLEMSKANAKNPWTAIAYQRISAFQSAIHQYNLTEDKTSKDVIDLLSLLQFELPRLAELSKLDPDEKVLLSENGWKTERVCTVRQIPYPLVQSPLLSIRRTVF